MDTRTKVKAVSAANAEPERIFSLMNRVKSRPKNRLLGESTDERMRCWLHCSKDKKEVDWDDWEKRFQALTAPISGFYGVSYDEETKMFKEYIAPTDLTVKTLT